MIVILWEYLVKTDRLAEFESLYAQNGTWAQLFKRDSGYLHTELLRDARNPQRYITIDRWVSVEAYNSFQAKWHAEYQELDVRCEDLTDSEALLGVFSGLG